MPALSLLGDILIRSKAMMEQALSKAVLHIPLVRNSKDRIVVLTIDDAPSSRTPELLAILSKHEASETFFVHTDYIVTPEADRTEIIRQIVANGHELGHHMPYDTPSIKLSQQEFAAEFQRSHDVLMQVQPAGPKYFRPAGGYYHHARMGETLAAFGYDRPLGRLGSDKTYILGGFLAWDTLKTNSPNRVKNLHQAEKYANQLLANLYSGSIVVFHDGDHKGFDMRLEATIFSLDYFLSNLSDHGFRAVNLTQAIDQAAAERESLK